MIYAAPGAAGAKVQFKAKYDNFIGGKWTPPVKGEYFDNVTPITGKPICRVARSGAEDIELALDAAHAAGILLYDPVFIPQGAEAKRAAAGMYPILRPIACNTNTGSAGHDPAFSSFAFWMQQAQ